MTLDIKKIEREIVCVIGAATIMRKSTTPGIGAIILSGIGILLLLLIREILLHPIVVIVLLLAIGAYFISKEAKRRGAQQEAARVELETRPVREQELEYARYGTLEPIDPGAVVLAKGEEAFIAIDAALVELKTVRWRGRSTGISMRLFKGVWLRHSGAHGAPEQEIVPVAQGELVATNQRLIFAGDQKTVTVPLDKISSFEEIPNGLRFSNARRTFNFILGNEHGCDVFVTIADRLLREHT